MRIMPADFPLGFDLLYFVKFLLINAVLCDIMIYILNSECKMALINCDNIQLSYENHTVISELSFTVESGDYLCIVGENGSGKSTLIKALLGLKSVQSGTIKFGDGLKQKEIGYLPQQTGAQKDFPASVREVVLSGVLNGLGIRPFYTKAEKALAEENMKKLHIDSLAEKCYRELSGGQQQRVLLARALCATKKLLLLDEPTASLDPVVSVELYHLIKEINKSGITVIMVSHDIHSSLHNASHILHLHKDFTFFGTTDQYTECEHCKRFVGESESGCSCGL